MDLAPYSALRSPASAASAVTSGASALLPPFKQLKISTHAANNAAIRYSFFVIDTSCSCLLVAVSVNLLLYLIKPSFGMLRDRRRIRQKERSIGVGSWPRR
jgi:hypothetical protein